MNPRRHDPIKPAVAQLQAYDPHKRPGQVKLDAIVIGSGTPSACIPPSPKDFRRW